MSTELPELKRHPGLKTWKVRDKGHWLTSYKHVHRSRKTTIVTSMFPSGKTWDEYDISDTAEQDCGRDEIKKETTSENVRNKEEGISSEENIIENDGIEGQAEVTSLPLERCMRILPHDQDTGGFFIAVFRKVSPFSVEDMKSKELFKRHNFRSTQDSEEANPGKTELDPNLKEIMSSDFDNAACSLNMKNDTFSQQDSEVTEIDTLGSASCIHSNALNAFESILDELGDVECASEICQTIEDAQKKEKVDTDDRKLTWDGNQAKKGKIQQQGRWRGVDPVLLFTDEKAIDSIVTYYGIDKSFQLLGHLVTRNSDTVHVKRIYYVSTSVRDAIELNFSAGQQLKITSVGLKLFERQTAKDGASPCAYRISSEGLPLLLPYLRKRILYASLVDFKLLLSSRTLYFKEFQDPEFITQVSNLLPGCCVIILRTDEADTNNFCLASNQAYSEKPTIAVGCWKGRTNMSLMVSKLESEELFERIVFKYGK